MSLHGINYAIYLFSSLHQISVFSHYRNAFIRHTLSSNDSFVYSWYISNVQWYFTMYHGTLKYNENVPWYI